MTASLTKSEWVVSWICRIVAAVILGQTLFFKFTGAEESVYIFTKVGLESWGRYGSGVAELIAATLLLTPRLAWAGSLLALGVISGALVSHLTVLGIVVKDDRGLNYYHRERGTLIESNRFAALNATRELREGYERLDPMLLMRPLNVTCKTSYATSGSQASPSTVGREIMYSVAHAVHHYALI